MAIIDAVWWTVRRKLGGAVGASWRGAPYIRQRVSTCDASTRRQSRSRALWARAHWYWLNVLEEWERQDWRNAVAPRSWRDPLTQYRPLTGCGLFVAYASRVMLAGLTPLHDPYELWWGMELETMSLELVTPSRVRVTFTPDPGEWHCLVLFGRGPLSVGAFPDVEEAVWAMYAVPYGWRWIGYGGAGVVSPIEFDLPWTVAAGLKLRAIGGLMALCGDCPSDWKAAEVVG